MNKNGVKIHLGERVKEIVADKGCVRGIKLANDFFYSDIIILATGGLSYPKTGSQGDDIYGFKIRS